MTSEKQTYIEEYHPRRVSIEEANEAFRSKDGLEPGAVITGAAGILLRPLATAQQMFKSHDVDSNKVELSEEGIITATDTDFYDDLFEEEGELLLHGLYLATDIAEIVEIANVTEIDDTQPEKLRDRYDYIRQEYIAFTQENPDVSLNSFGGVVAFVDFYETRLGQFLLKTKAPERVKRFRDDLLAQFNAGGLSRYISTQQRQRMISEVSAVPIIIADPLMASFESINYSIDYSGWYNPRNRVAYIDPASTFTSTKNQIGYGHNEQFESLFLARLRQVTYHELIHATNSQTYSYTNHLNGGEAINYHILWPNFLVEGMVEKIAYLATAQKEGTFTNRLPTRFSERILRKIVDASEIEVMGTRKMQNLREALWSPYMDYRLIIDTLIARLDWDRVGLNQKKAESLLIAAFLEYPKRNGQLDDQASPYRKKLSQAINKAGHPGMLNKLGMLENLLGPGPVLDILQAPDFDPHDPDMVPWLVSPVHLRKLTKASENKTRSRFLLSQYETIDTPSITTKEEIDKLRSYSRKAEKQEKEYNLFKLASRGLLAEIRHKRGYLKRQLLPSDVLLGAICGYKARERLFDSEDDKTGKKALADYRKKYVKPARY